VLHRVKAFVITGGALMAVSLFMLSRLDATSALWVVWSAEVVMGLGMGMVISKLIMAAQNVVDRREIGTITGQAATFRIIGSTLGVALLGAVLTARLGVAQRELPQADLDTLPQGADVLYQDPAAIKDLATSLPALHEQVVTAYAQSLQTVFLVALPIMLVAFTLSWFLPNTKLRGEEDYAKAGDGSPGSHDAPRPDGWDGPPGARLTEGLARSDEPRSDAT
jgi:MFS family permease